MDIRGGAFLNKISQVHVKTMPPHVGSLSHNLKKFRKTLLAQPNKRLHEKKATKSKAVVSVA